MAHGENPYADDKSLCHKIGKALYFFFFEESMAVGAVQRSLFRRTELRPKYTVWQFYRDGLHGFEGT